MLRAILIGSLSAIFSLIVGTIGIFSGAFYGLAVLVGIAWKGVTGAHMARPDIGLLIIAAVLTLAAGLGFALLVSLRIWGDGKYVAVALGSSLVAHTVAFPLLLVVLS